MKVVIAGGRDITDYEVLLTAILNAGFDITEVVSGRARGADTLGERFAAECYLPVKPFPANWDKYGRRAGIMRNGQMADYGECLIALWDGKSTGTKNMIDQAKQNGLQVYVEIVNAPVQNNHARLFDPIGL